MIKAAAKLGYQPVGRGGAPAVARRDASASSATKFSTDPWTAIGFDGVREKAWERGLTVTVMATRGDADMEAAALAQLASQPLLGLIYATINTRLVDAPALGRSRRSCCSIAMRRAARSPRSCPARSPAATPRPTS